jgi:hypothetical protein
MDIDAVQGFGPFIQFDFTVQHAARLHEMTGNVQVLPGLNGEAGQDGIAMMAFVIDRVLAVGELGPQRVRQKLVLWLLRPVRKPARAALVRALHFLKKNDVRLQCMQFFP